MNQSAAYALSLAQGTIDSFIQSEMKKYNLPGIGVAMIDNGRLEYAKGFGYADSEGTVVTPQTGFIIGSLSKLITSSAIYILSEQGKLDIDDPIGKYLPWLPEQPKSQVTVRHLLNFTSGYDRDMELVVILSPFEDIKKGKVNVPWNEEKLNRSYYSNFNYMLLGQIIEAASGMTYEQFVQTYLFDPLEMKRTYADVSKAPDGFLSEGHASWFGYNKSMAQPYEKEWIPAGYLVSTLEDWSHFILMLLGDGTYNGVQVLNLLSVMHVLGESNSLFEFGGATYVFKTHLMMNRVFDRAVIVFTNARDNLFVGFYPDAVEPADRIGRDLYNSFDEQTVKAVKARPYPRLFLYTIVDSICLLLIACTIFSLIRWRRWGIRQGGWLRRSTSAAILLFQIGFPLYYSYETLWIYQIEMYSMPGVYPLILSLSGIWLVIGVIKVALMAIKFRQTFPVKGTNV